MSQLYDLLKFLSKDFTTKFPIHECLTFTGAFSFVKFEETTKEKQINYLHTKT